MTLAVPVVNEDGTTLAYVQPRDSAEPFRCVLLQDWEPSRCRLEQVVHVPQQVPPDEPQVGQYGPHDWSQGAGRHGQAKGMVMGSYPDSSIMKVRYGWSSVWVQIW